jgi:hypothetical protein
LNCERRRYDCHCWKRTYTTNNPSRGYFPPESTGRADESLAAMMAGSLSTSRTQSREEMETEKRGTE